MYTCQVHNKTHLDAFFSVTAEAMDLICVPLERGESPLSICTTLYFHEFILPFEKHENLM